MNDTYEAIDNLDEILDIFNLRTNFSDVYPINVVDDNNNVVGYIFKESNYMLVNIINDNYKLLGKYNLDDLCFKFNYHTLSYTINGDIKKIINNNKGQYSSSLFIKHINGSSLKFDIFNNNSILNIDYNNESSKENIVVNSNIGVYHSVVRGKYNEGKESFPYSYFSAVFEINDILSIFLREEEGRKTINYCNKKKEVDFSNDYSDTLEQILSLIKVIDPNFFNRINEIVSSVCSDDLYIINNLFVKNNNVFDNNILYNSLCIDKNNNKYLCKKYS